ncbi:MAG: DUF192 domain-containing protein [Micropepsaceae bacterium]
MKNILPVTLVALAFLMSGAMSGIWWAGAAPRVERLKIDCAKGNRSFYVEVVREEAERNKGLMFRKHMAANHGMLFDYDPPQVVGFWMKNTFIPLDIIFIGADGRIIRIQENAVPLSLTHIPSGGEARAVLEINGGLAAKLGIRTGDVVHHSLFQSPH